MQLLFEYIQMLKDAKMQEWIFREIQQVDATDVRCKEKDVRSPCTPPLQCTTRSAVDFSLLFFFFFE